MESVFVLTARKVRCRPISSVIRHEEAWQPILSASVCARQRTLHVRLLTSKWHGGSFLEFARKLITRVTPVKIPGPVLRGICKIADTQFVCGRPGQHCFMQLSAFTSSSLASIFYSALHYSPFCCLSFTCVTSIPLPAYRLIRTRFCRAQHHLAAPNGTRPFRALNSA
jgi:hypothetical protein